MSPLTKLHLLDLKKSNFKIMMILLKTTLKPKNMQSPLGFSMDCDAKIRRSLDLKNKKLLMKKNV